MVWLPKIIFERQSKTEADTFVFRKPLLAPTVMMVPAILHQVNYVSALTAETQAADNYL